MDSLWKTALVPLSYATEGDSSWSDKIICSDIDADFNGSRELRDFSMGVFGACLSRDSNAAGHSQLSYTKLEEIMNEYLILLSKLSKLLRGQIHSKFRHLN